MDKEKYETGDNRAANGRQKQFHKHLQLLLWGILPAVVAVTSGLVLPLETIGIVIAITLSVGPFIILGGASLCKATLSTVVVMFSIGIVHLCILCVSLTIKIIFLSLLHHLT